MSSKKLKKQGQQEDLQQIEMLLVEKYKKPFIVGCVLLVVAVIGWNLYKSSSESAHQEAVENRYMAENAFMEALSNRNFDAPLNGDSLTVYHTFAQLAGDDNVSCAYAGLCYANEGDWENAVAQLEKFEPQDDATITPRVLCVLANAYANLGNAEKAIATFKSAANQAEAIIAADCLMQAAEIYVSQGNKAEARALYQQIKSDYCFDEQLAVVVARKLMLVEE